jgi:hypothetical protein
MGVKLKFQINNVDTIHTQVIVMTIGSQAEPLFLSVAIIKAKQAAERAAWIKQIATSAKDFQTGGGIWGTDASY